VRSRRRSRRWWGYIGGVNQADRRHRLALLADLRNNDQRGVLWSLMKCPLWDDAAVERMLRLGKALDEGNYDEEFDNLFPPETTDAQGEG
jgi:hypothetical protein